MDAQQDYENRWRVQVEKDVPLFGHTDGLVCSS